jgi:hypothetical protein
MWLVFGLARPARSSIPGIPPPPPPLSPHPIDFINDPRQRPPYHTITDRVALAYWLGRDKPLPPPELPILTLGPGLVLGSQWTIHLWGPSSSSGLPAISGPEADLILTHHLGLEKCNVLGDDEITGMWYKLKRQPLCSGRGTSRGMLVSVELRDPRGGSPFSISNNLC